MDEEQAVRQNIGLIGKFMSKNPKPNGVSFDEYESELRIALWRSLRKHDPKLEKTAAISTYAMRGMAFAYRNLIRNRARWSRYGTDEGIDSVECRKEVEVNSPPVSAGQLVEALEGKDKELISKFLAGKTTTQIARECKVTRQAVNKHWWNCVKKMRRIAFDAGIKSTE